MSAFVAVAYEDRVELVTDGAVVAPDGTVARIHSKVWMSERLPIAFAGRGNVGALMHIGLYLSKAVERGTVDGALERFSEELAGGLPRLKGSQIDGVVCAVSQTSGSHVLYFTTSDTVGGFEPFKLYDMPAMAAGSEPPDEALAGYGFPGRFLEEPLSACGADAIDVMRRYRMTHQNQGGHQVFGVGGHVDLTVIDVAGARTSRLRTWPEDVPGRKIEPLAA